MGKLKFKQLLGTDSNGYILYSVRYSEDIKTLRDFINEALRLKKWGYISIKMETGGVDIEYRGTKILSKFDKGLLDYPLKNFMTGAQGKQDRMDYLVEIKPYTTEEKEGKKDDN